MSRYFTGCLLFHLSALAAVPGVAQTCTVSVSEAELTDGKQVVGTVPKGTQLYSSQQQGNWLRCINPETLEPAWIAATDVTVRPIKRADADQLLQQRSRVVDLANQSSALPSDLAAVKTWMQQTEGVFGSIHPSTVRAIQLTGLVAANSRNLSEGRQLLEQSIQRANLVYGKDTSEVAEIHLDLAYLLADMSLLADAARQAKAAAVMRANLFGADHPDTMEAFLPLAEAMESISDDQAAFDLYQKVFASYKASYGTQDERTLKVGGRLADAAARLGRTQLARQTQQEILDVLKSMGKPERRWIARIELKLRFLDLNLDNESEIRDFLVKTEQFAKQMPEDAAFASALARQLVSSLFSTGDTDAAFDVIDHEMQQLRQSLRVDLWGLDEATQLAYLRYAASGPFFEATDAAWRFRQSPQVMERSSEWLLNGKALVREVNAVRTGFRNDTDKRRRWIEQPSVGLDEFRAALPKDSVFVDLLRLPLSEDDGSEHYVAWLTPQSGRQQIIPLGRADETDRLIVRFLESLQRTAMKCSTDGEDVAFAEMLPDLRKLSERLWHPIERSVTSQTILMAPDSQTWLVPWGALLNQNGRFAIEDYLFQFHVSGREIARSQGVSATNTPVIFANPDFGEAREKQSASDLRSGELADRIPSVNPLENTLQEAAAARIALEDLTGNSVSVLLAGQAMERKFKDLESPSVILMSTHGFLLPNDILSEAADPLLRCGLLLANANRHTDHTLLEDDGVLTALEVMATDLSDTQLVVLSACDTGVGEIAAVEGVNGLRSAFRLAGVSCVVSTLWPIHDRETTYLMKDFFQDLTNSGSAAEALQQAQQKRISRHRERYGAAHPFFWAAFTATGHMTTESLAR